MKNSENGRIRILLVFVLLAGLLAALFLTGYLRKSSREFEAQAAVARTKASLPRVNVALARPAASKSDLVLPGNITPLTEAAINARAEGYVKVRTADIGDRVRPGQLLAEIEAPELDQQVQQARAALSPQGQRDWHVSVRPTRNNSILTKARIRHPGGSQHIDRASPGRAFGSKRRETCRDRTITECFCDRASIDRIVPSEVGDGARDFEHSVIPPSRQRELFRGCLQHVSGS